MVCGEYSDARNPLSTLLNTVERVHVSHSTAAGIMLHASDKVGHCVRHF